jgi:hypothetical protein
VLRCLRRSGDRKNDSSQNQNQSFLCFMLSDAELTEPWSFWMWDPLKEEWDFIRDWEESKFEPMRKFEEYVFGRDGALGQDGKRYLPLTLWFQ